MTLGSGVKERITRGRLWQVVYKSNIPTTDTTDKAGFVRKRSGSQLPIQSTDVFSVQFSKENCYARFTIRHKVWVYSQSNI